LIQPTISLEMPVQNSCQISAKLSEANVKNTFTSHIDKKKYFWHFCWNLIFIKRGQDWHLQVLTNPQRYDNLMQCKPYHFCNKRTNYNISILVSSSLVYIWFSKKNITPLFNMVQLNHKKIVRSGTQPQPLRYTLNDLIMGNRIIVDREAILILLIHTKLLSE
jgi:hypothetical protein